MFNKNKHLDNLRIIKTIAEGKVANTGAGVLTVMYQTFIKHISNHILGS
jgi:hypothetical protein